MPDKTQGGVAKGGDSGANTKVVRDSAAGWWWGGETYNQASWFMLFVYKCVAHVEEKLYTRWCILYTLHFETLLSGQRGGQRRTTVSKNDQRASVVGGHWTLVLYSCSLHRYHAGHHPVQHSVVKSID